MLKTDLAIGDKVAYYGGLGTVIGTVKELRSFFARVETPHPTTGDLKVFHAMYVDLEKKEY